MSFRRQLVIGNTALLLLILAIAATASIALRMTSNRLERVARDLSTDASDAERLRFEAEQVVAISRGFLLTGDQTLLPRFDRAVEQVDGSLTAFDTRGGERAEEVTAINDATRDYVAAARRAARQRTTTSTPETVIPFFEQTVAPARERLATALETFVNGQQAAFERVSRAGRDFAARTQWIVFATTALSILLGIGLAWTSIRTLNRHYARERSATAATRLAIADRDELLAIVSHDLRNPLSALTMRASLLSETEDNPHVRKQATAMYNAAMHMQHMIGELLDVARLERGSVVLRREPCAASGMFDTLVSLFQMRAVDAGVELSARVDRDLAVTADRERILEVLSNLVDNALKFTPPGGRIAVAARPEEREVRFEVSDSGPGIPNEQVPRLFDRYWHGRAGSSGHRSLGLGLYICKQLVAAHGGQIGVQTTPDEGTTFWFTLPPATARGAELSDARQPRRDHEAEGTRSDSRV